jgi:hypothetical protein
MFWDLVRWLILFESSVALGTLLAIFQRAHRVDRVPTVAVRMLIAASALLLSSVMLTTYQHLDQPFSVRTPLSLVAVTVYLAALVKIWRDNSPKDSPGFR